MCRPIFIPEMASMLGITDAALRTKIQRDYNLPIYVKKEGRITWTLDEYTKWRQNNQPQERTNE